ncbi:hypothetical protein P153DRAFT_369049 [Dothidotthia symphoricarpi CBS 119687]|uniref:Heterokaryon incompatibility domain-containing protein n=1 Tax=Dothidotthia symphoricarpi CBS 119687 TaxID=1392245 RepID=A0A6A6A577_9PLEO|nr:uncharacterized protein P153DRAFT_369049 [Dothidotthia symphoricarpi CBS 119687]KAF2126325.1 hypothetical protein P153DRAFT_369049 [Dothidotthia symphoricarpi CBS 119687]
MVHLLIGEWFTRLWTFQEVVLSRRAVILCGDSSLDMDEFLDFIVVGRYRLFCFPFPLPDHTSGVKPHWNECRSLRIYHRKRSTSGEGLDAKAVPLLLDNVRHRQMKEQVDRIWAVFGLFHPHLQDQLASLVDYSDTARQEHWRTFAGCLKIVVRESASFDLLEFSGQSGPRNGHLPSWCPNFIDDTVQRGYIFGMWNREINKQRNVVQTLLIAEDDKKAYERWSSIEYHHKKDISTTKSDYTLRVRGFLVDTIVEVVQDMHLIDVRDGIENFDSYGPGIENPIIVATVNWESQSLDLARRVYHGENGSDEDVPPEYIMALCTDCRINENCDEAYRNAISSLTTVDWHASNKLEPRQLSQESHFWGHLTSMAGHPSFSTKGGRFGVATPGCKPGDRVCMFYGGHPLYIMRWPTTDANTDAEHDKLPAEFVGTAFIPHLMEPHQSEAARLAPDEIFIIG